MVEKRKNKSSVAHGRPAVPDNQRHSKILNQRTVNMTDEMWERLKDEAEGRGMDASELNREVLSWYFTALDTKRGDASNNKIFDEVLA